jgi:putative oxidoreductase
MVLEEPSHTPVHTGLLVLRSSGLFLLLTFGWQKLFGLFHIIHAGAFLGSAGLAPLIRDAGFPAPVLASVYVTFSESILALLIALGLFTRLSAACAALSMAGAFYFSLRVGEEPLRAALYLLIFATLALTGPGRFSLDYLRRPAAI